MDPLQIIVALLEMGAGASANASTQALNWANLNETKRANRKGEQLATSSREDALGNLVEYVPGVGWKVRATPTTKGILDAEQTETLASLTQDAPRQRKSAERRNKRAISADEEFQDAFNDYRYRPQKSEEEFIGDTTTELLSARRKGIDELGSVLQRGLLRGGRGDEFASVFKAGDDAYAGSLEDALLRGKTKGREAFMADKAGREGLAQKELAFLSGLAGDEQTLPIRSDSSAMQLSGTADQALQQLLSTIGGNDARRSGAMSQVAQGAGKTLDFSNLARALGGGFGDNDEEDDRETTWQDVIRYISSGR
jgi:hypothetical protein